MFTSDHFLRIFIQALCWYDLEMQPEDFEDKGDVTDIINEWAEHSAKMAKEAIDVKADNTDFPLQPLAGHTGLFATDKVDTDLKILFRYKMIHFSDYSCSFHIFENSMETWTVSCARYKNGPSIYCIFSEITG